MNLSEIAARLPDDMELRLCRYGGRKKMYHAQIVPIHQPLEATEVLFWGAYGGSFDDAAANVLDRAQRDNWTKNGFPLATPARQPDASEGSAEHG